MATLLDTFVTRFDFKTDKAALRGLERNIDRVRRRLDSVSRGALLIGAGLTAGLGLTTKTFANYEANLAKIEGLVGVSREQLNAWSDDLDAIAVEGGRSIEEVTDALFYVTSAGLRGSVAMDVLRMAARGSAAGLGDMKTIADLVTSAINAYGEANLSAEDATDTLTEAVRLGKLEPAALASSMGRVLPMASALNVKFNEVAGMMAAMSKTGTSAEESVTSLNAIMIGLIKPTAGADDALHDVGLSVALLRDTAGGPSGLWGVLRSLKTAFGDNVDKMAEVFPNIRALRGVFDLLGPQMESNVVLMNEMTDSTGTLGEAYETVAGTLKHQFGQVLSKFSIIKKDLGQINAPGIQKMLDLVDRLWERFNSLSDGVKSFIAQVLLIGPALIGVGLVLKGVSFALGALVPILRGVGTLLSALRFLWIAAFGPVGLIVAAAAALIMLAWEPISTFFTGLWESLTEGTKRVGDAFGRLLEEMGPVGDGIKILFDGIAIAWSRFMSIFQSDETETGRGFGDFIVDGIVAVIDAITSVIWFFGLIPEAAKAAWGKVVDLAQYAKKCIIQAFVLRTRLFDWIAEEFNKLGLAEIAIKIRDSFVEIFNTPLRLFDWISEQFKEVVDKLIGFAPEWLRNSIGLGDADTPELPSAAPDSDAPGTLENFKNYLFGGADILGSPVLASTSFGPSPATTSNRATTITVEKIEVNAEGGDPDVIASGISSKLSEQFHNLVEDFDSPLAR